MRNELDANMHSKRQSKHQTKLATGHRVLLLQLDMNYTWIMPQDLFRYYLAKHVIEGLMVRDFECVKANLDSNLTNILQKRDWRGLLDIGLGESVYRNMLTAPSEHERTEPRYYVNRALLRLGGSLRAAGYDCDYFNLEFPESTTGSLFSLVSKEQYQLVCVSAITPTVNQLFRVVGPTVKAANPGAKIVLGGHHATFADEDALRRSSCIDYIVRGEGERTVVELADAVMRGRSVDEIVGVTYRDRDGLIVHNPDRELVQDVNSLPEPDFTLLDPRKKYIYYFLVSRGCRFRCAFCADSALWRHRIRFFDTTRLKNELQGVLNWLGGDVSMICADSNSMLDETVFKAFVESYNGLKPQPPKIFNLLTRANTLTPSRLRMAQQLPCTSLDLGVENAVDTVLERMNKGLTFQENIAALEMIRKYAPEFKRNAIWVVGFPGENSSTRKTNLSTARDLLRDELVHDIDPSLFVPHVGTPPYLQPDAFGMDIHTRDWSSYNYHRHSVYTTRDQSVDFMWSYMIDFYDVVLEGMFDILLRRCGCRRESRFNEFLQFCFRSADTIWINMHLFYLRKGWML